MLADLLLINHMIDEAKVELKKTIANHQGIRHLREDALTDTVKDEQGNPTGERKPIKHNIISMFPSIMSRTLGIKKDELTMDIMIFESSFTDILESLIKHGFMYREEKYIVYTASAGQIRTSKVVMIKEKVLTKHRDSLMCGLSIERINQSEHRGANVNKYLAYLALGQSASEPWYMDIDKCIVVDDFETLVNGAVDFIDHNTYEITPKEMDIPIAHTDGCGMILPTESSKNFQFRAPFFKGLLGVFPFDKFLTEVEGASPIVKDIWGKDWDIIESDIRIIFTKSQFKMWKYYSSWQEYKDFYKLHGCQAGKCSEDEDRGNAMFGYQMIQTLTDIKENELLHIASKTINDINLAGSDINIMLKVLGVGDGNQSPIQQALKLLPELAGDEHSSNTLKDNRLSMIKRAKYSKLEIEAKYTFIIPDLYAFCERLFLKHDKPKGLLSDGEVFCDLYPDNDRLLCLRSPHLYREHAVRNNIVDEIRSEWFLTSGLYTSSHDLISKLLQFDVDGDDSLVVADKKIIEIADRNMKNDNIVPLYYEMATAKAEVLSNESIYNGLSQAFRGSGNIGKYSNAISKIWNTENPDLRVTAWLTMENNFSIDQAKTLYMPKRPKEINEIIKSALGKKLKSGKYQEYKLPRFFIYAKDKDENEVEKVNYGVISRLVLLLMHNVRRLTV